VSDVLIVYRGHPGWDREKEEYVVVTFKAKKSLRDLLDKCAKRLGVSRSDIIRMAIKLYLEVQGCNEL